jgi:hypothetical protein
MLAKASRCSCFMQSLNLKKCGMIQSEINVIYMLVSGRVLWIPLYPYVESVGLFGGEGVGIGGPYGYEIGVASFISQ